MDTGLRIHYLQHVAFEDLGCMEDWIEEKGHTLTFTKFYDTNNLPELFSFDWLIIMGGPMGVYDDDTFNWLRIEKEFIRKAIDAGKKVLGICLGAQLIASVLGAKVYANKSKEIGWFPISKSSVKKPFDLFDNFPDTFTVFHWHGDTFELPDKAVNLCSSAVCAHQGFLFTNKVMGLQFHFEVTEDSLKKMITFGGNELTKGDYIQTADKILAGKKYIAENNKRMYQLLDAFSII